MSSVPREVLRDVLQPLDRWTLDDVQFTNRRFLQLILESMSDVCLRKVNSAHFIALDAKKFGNSFYSIHIGTRRQPKRRISNGHKDPARLFSEFAQALRSSHVMDLALVGLVFTPGLAALVLESPIFARELSFHGVSCAELTPVQLNKVLRHFSPTFLCPLDGHFRACQISDELIRALFKKGTVEANLANVVPVDGGSFAVSDDVIVELRLQPDADVGQEQQDVEDGEEEDDDEPYVDLILRNGSFTKDLVKRLVEASAVSTRMQSLQVVVSPSPVMEEDLRDFAQHLSYCRRGDWNQLRIYDFPSEQQGAADTTHLQIVLHSDNRLEVIRALRSDLPFYEADE